VLQYFKILPFIDNGSNGFVSTFALLTEASTMGLRDTEISSTKGTPIDLILIARYLKADMKKQ
jgi:hypothetical protein